MNDFTFIWMFSLVCPIEKWIYYLNTNIKTKQLTLQEQLVYFTLINRFCWAHCDIAPDNTYTYSVVRICWSGMCWFIYSWLIHCFDISGWSVQIPVPGNTNLLFKKVIPLCCLTSNKCSVYLFWKSSCKKKKEMHRSALYTCTVACVTAGSGYNSG